MKLAEATIGLAFILPAVSSFAESINVGGRTLVLEPPAGFCVLGDSSVERERFRIQATFFGLATNSSRSQRHAQKLRPFVRARRWISRAGHLSRYSLPQAPSSLSIHANSSLRQ